ncbi:SDR family oxidoreductase [Streptomyces sp. GbtcB7]|uniref:SDR family oxidoreductase n=1 Tax=Streptomyces sp. GbtcB7 TaxID=2824752 RepID=UPI001C305513|nr:SDR family oxidoreductase [Streptomyces sp. GbtcB7]
MEQPREGRTVDVGGAQLILLRRNGANVRQSPFARSPAHELGNRGTAVNGMSPNPTGTPMKQGFLRSSSGDQASMDATVAMTPLGRTAGTDDIAITVLLPCRGRRIRHRTDARRRQRREGGQVNSK